MRRGRVRAAHPCPSPPLQRGRPRSGGGFYFPLPLREGGRGGGGGAPWERGGRGGGGGSCCCSRGALPLRARPRHRPATPPGRGCDARRRLRVPTSKPTPVIEKRGIVCVG